MRRLLVAATVCAVACACARDTSSTPTSPNALSSQIVTIVDLTEGLEITSGQTGTFNWVGQSIVMPQGGPYTNIRLNWYTFKKQPTAFGTLYVLSREFLGLPGELGSSTPGVVGRSEAVVGGEYVFASTVQLNGGTKYWFYTDTQGSFAGSFDTDIYPAGDMYVSGHRDAPFRRAQASGRMVNGTYVPPPPGVFLDANFRLQGSMSR